jgi:hypothetical protein
MTTKLMGANVWEEALYEHLTSHEEKERELLVEYKQATSSGSWHSNTWLRSSSATRYAITGCSRSSPQR